MADEILKPIRLSPEMKERLQGMSANLRILETEIARAKRAKLPGADDLEKRFMEMKTMRDNLLREYA